MENYTTQEHHRSHNNTIVENPGRTLAKLRARQQNRNFINGMIIAAMTLTVAVTGTMLGATAAHNNQLKAEISKLQTQNASLAQRINETEANPPEKEAASTDNKANLNSQNYYARYRTEPRDFISQKPNHPVTLPELPKQTRHQIDEINVPLACR